MHGVARKQVLRLTWIPSGEVHDRAVLKGVADRVQHIGLNPKWVAGLAGPDTQTGGRGNGLASCSLCHDCACRMGVHSLRAPGAAHDVALIALLVTLVKLRR